MHRATAVALFFLDITLRVRTAYLVRSILTAKVANSRKGTVAQDMEPLTIASHAEKLS